MSILIDSYSESNADQGDGIYGGNISAQGQSFTCSGTFSLSTCKFYLSKFGSPTGNCFAKLYAHSGTYGTTSVPTGAALATSDAFDVSTLPTIGSPTLKTFTFSGANKISLTSNFYVIVFEYTGGDASNYAALWTDASAPTASGNGSQYNGSWSAQAYDTCFYVYGLKQYIIACLPATFTYTAQAQGHKRVKYMLCLPATYVFTAKIAALKRVVKMICHPATYSFVGKAVTIVKKKVYTMICIPAVYLFTALPINIIDSVQRGITRLTRYIALRKIK